MWGLQELGVNLRPVGDKGEREQLPRWGEWVAHLRQVTPEVAQAE